MGGSLFNEEWQFLKTPLSTQYEHILNEDMNWEEVTLPHDWMIYNTNDLYENSIGWYRKDFMLERVDGKKYFIHFDGVYMDSTIYVNDQMVGEWKYGYSSFEYEITDYVTLGMNNIKVKVVYQSPNSRWYSGAGIYRNVYLKTLPSTYLVTDGIYITTRKEDEGFLVEFETEVFCDAEDTSSYTIIQEIYNRENELVVRQEDTLPVGQGVISKSQNLKVFHPILWSTIEPYLYTVITTLRKDNELIDEARQKMGFRTIRFDKDTGFYLNDINVKIHGVCEHHDLGALGAAFNKTAMRRKFVILKEMGVNGVRTSHNMPSKEFMELADELGMLIVSEGFDMWEMPKTEYDYARFFNEWVEKDVASWIRRDRNHPSVILWSIGNEIYDTHAGVRGLEITKMLKELVLTHDPKQNGYVTMGSNFMAWENTQRCTEELLIAGYNYGEYLYEEHHKRYPHWIIYGSETASTIQSRGIYHFPADNASVTYEDEQCSSLGNCHTAWGAKNTQYVIEKDRDAKYTFGQFIWTGFDYIGEPTPYFTKNSYFGQIDTAGFKKDSYYFYQAEWTDYKISPMIHILPYWDFNEGQLIDIRVYSNAPKIELFCNEVSVGTYDIDHEHGTRLYGAWQLPYKAGEIKAVAYNDDGEVIATDFMHSFSESEKIVLKPDKTTLIADGIDMIFIEITMEDKDGYEVKNANNRVHVSVSGAGRLVGLDNGDSTDYDQYKGVSRRLFQGKLLAMIAATKSEGEIKVRVSSSSLPDSEITLLAINGEGSSFINTEAIASSTIKNHEIPVRKIELTRNGSMYLDDKKKEVEVLAKIYPRNATYKELEWKVVTKGGIPSNLASLEIDGYKAKVTALGDGEFRLQCSCRNGTSRPTVISEYEFIVSNIGEANINPYEFVAAALYNVSNCIIDNGKEGGVATREGDVTHIGFKGVDFGEYGSDEITIPIYSLNSDEIPIEIWEGMPGEVGSNLILNTLYMATPIWNTYQEKTYKLPYLLKGIKTLTIVLNRRVEVKGFIFTKINKSDKTLKAIENNGIYGDSFTYRDGRIENIGNNVSIEFDFMDFVKECCKITICGRSNTKVNTIHIQFVQEDKVIKEVVEITYSKEYEVWEYEISPKKGYYKVQFIFLPGSNFDFDWFRFS